MTYGQTRDTDLESNNGEIWGIYVDVDYWNRGIGKKLMLWAEESFKRNNYTKIFLWTLKDNEKARTFYEDIGYKHDGKRKVINLGKDLEVIRYQKETGKI